MNRSEQEVTRLLLEAQVDPILGPVLARCDRPKVGPFFFKSSGITCEHSLTVLVIPCPDRETADFLRSVSWDWFFIRFWGACHCIVFQFPESFHTVVPREPRSVALTGAVRALVSGEIEPDVEDIELTSSGWMSLPGYPTISLGCSKLATLNEYLRHIQRIQSLAIALVPELQSLDIFFCAHDGIMAYEGISIGWLRTVEGWQLKPLEPGEVNLFALALLSETGLTLPFAWSGRTTPSSTRIRFTALDASICDRTLSLSGTRDALNACLALLDPLRRLVNRLRHIPQIAQLERVEFSFDDGAIAFPLLQTLEVLK